MALRDTIYGVVDKVRGLVKRKPKAMDAFGGDDLYEAEDDGVGSEGSSNLGTKIAFGVSGLMLLGLIGTIGAIFMMGDDSASKTGGSLAGIEVEEEPATVECGAERRPWLTPTQGGSRRLGMSEDASAPESKPSADGSAVKSPPMATREVAKVEPMKPPPAGQDTQAAKKPEPAKGAEPEKKPAADAKLEPTKVAEAAPEPKADTPATADKNKSAPAKEAPPAQKPQDAKPEMAADADDEPADAKQQTAALPSLMSPAQTAPGAPRRFETENNVAATAGGKPRLNDPNLPPVDRTSIGAPPPRFAAIATIKVDPPTAATSAKVAIVVEGLGLNKAATEAALTKLPPSVTLAFSPYARDLKKLMDRAKQRGHEVLIEVPMEGKGFPADDPGPLGLLTSLEPKDNQDRLETILKEATGAVGVFDSTGSKFRESQSHIGDVLGKLKQQNLFYVQGRPGVRVGDTVVPSATTDIVLDERPFRASVDARFDYAERLAKYQGSSVAVMDALPISFERLALWIDQLPKKGVTLAPVSQVLTQ